MIPCCMGCIKVAVSGGKTSTLFYNLGFILVEPDYPTSGLTET